MTKRTDARQLDAEAEYLEAKRIASELYRLHRHLGPFSREDTIKLAGICKLFQGEFEPEDTNNNTRRDDKQSTKESNNQEQVAQGFQALAKKLRAKRQHQAPPFTTPSTPLRGGDGGVEAGVLG
jgi:hypothetical protein